MSWTIAAALTAAPLIAAVTVAWHRIRIRSLRRVLAAERAARRITEAVHHRDVCALQARLMEARSPSAVLAAADRELDRALAAHTTTRNPKEGGSP